MENISKALSVCADLLYYPEGDIATELRGLLDLINSTKKVEEFLENKSLKDIQSHYISMFDSNINGVECVPYASWWYKRRLMSKEALSISDFYIECGFEFNKKEFKMPPDHMALEIGFLSLLIKEGRFKEACTMIDEHLGWFNKLFECVRKKSKLYGEILSIVLKLVNNVKREGLCLKEF